MTELIFEDPLYLYIVLGLAELVLAVLWRERRTPSFAKAMLIPPILVLMVAGADYLVQTDREQLQESMVEIKTAIENNQISRIPSYLDDDFEAAIFGQTITKPMVVLFGQTQMEKREIDKINLYNLKIEFLGQRAKMHFTTIVTYGGNQRTGLIWDLEWLKRPEGWKMLRVREPKTGFEL